MSRTLILRHIRAALVLGLTVACNAACNHDLTRVLERKMHERNEEGKALLSTLDFEAAKATFDEVLEVDPTNPQAAFGWFVGDLLLLPESKPVRDVLDRCNQPVFRLADQVFGPNGLLGRAEEANRGSAAVEVHFTPRAGASKVVIPFSPNAVRSEVETRDDGSGPYRWIQITALTEALTENGWLTLEFNADDLTRGDSEVRAIADGVVVEVSELAGGIQFHQPSRGRVSTGWSGTTEGVSGTIRFARGGRVPGEALSIVFEKVAISAACDEPSCTASYVVDGTIDDTITPPIQLDETSLPFGQVQDDGGPPRREGHTVALEACSPIDTAFLSGKVKELGDILAVESSHLRIVTEREGAESFTFTLPRDLLRMKNDLTLDVTDARVLKTAVDLASAVLELASQYTYLDGPIQDLIATRDSWVNPPPGGGSAPVREELRDLEPSRLVQNLGANLFSRAAGFRLDIFRDRLDQALVGASTALRNEARPPGSSPPLGVVNFRSLPSRRLADEFADLVDSARASVSSEGVVMVTSAPLFGFHLRSFFDNPLDRDRLLALTGLTALVHVEPGDPGNETAAQRNPRIVFDLACAVEEGTKWLGDVLKAPPDRTSISCGTALDCGEGYSCRTGSCFVDPPWALTEGAWESTVREDWPTFVNPTIRPLVDL